tara:strand:+ start:275 stop:505 length:231 start_codon:yes stop_codon:yes gene_type:complete
MIDQVIHITGADKHAASMLAVRYCVKDTTMSFQEASKATGIKRDPLFALFLGSDRRMNSKMFRDMYKKVKSQIVTP